MLQRRSVLKCVIDVIFYIGFQVWPNRIKHREAVATVFDKNNYDNRGEFSRRYKASYRVQSPGSFAEDHFARANKKIHIRKGVANL